VYICCVYGIHHPTRLSTHSGTEIGNCNERFTRSDVDGEVALPRRPFALVASCGGHATLKTMRNYFVDVCLVEPSGNNVLHEIVRIASMSKNCEVVMADTYAFLMRLLTSSTLEKLLLAENTAGLRPLELAAKMSTLRLYNGIVQTPGIYLTKVETHGPLAHKWYDVTEYESFLAGNRRHNSPIEFLLALEQAALYSDECQILLSRAPTRQWIDAKMLISRPFLFVWFVIRITYIGAFLLFENSEFSVNDRDTKSINCGEAVFDLPYWAGLATTVYVFTLSILILLLDIYEAAHFLLHNGRWRRWRTEGIISGRKAALHHNFYRVGQLLFVAMTMFRSTAWLFPATKIPLMSELSQIGACLVLPWTLFYFVQLLPSIGYFTVTIQTMFRDMMNFLLVFIIILAPFSYIFHMMLNYYSDEGCIPQFSSQSRSFYTTITIILNMVDFTAFRLTSPALIYALHIIFVFTATFLLVNFLVALMSNSVNEISEHRDVIMLMQRLSVAMVMENRVGRFLKSYYSHRQHENFVCRDGRIYVVDHCTRYDRPVDTNVEHV